MLCFSKHKRPVDSTIQDFYANKTLAKTDWWISDGSVFPDLYWARSRVFSDGTADAAFDSTQVFGFENETYAGYFLAEDGYIRLATFDDEDELFLEIKTEQLTPPIWPHESDFFRYIGKY